MRLLGLGVLLLVTWSASGADLPPLASAWTTWRASNHLNLPVWNSALAASAEGRSLALASQGALTHEDEVGRSAALQMVAEGLPPGEFGEVLGAGRRWEEVWEAWLASPPHRAVLAAPGWSRWGLGSTDLGPTTIWVLRVWRP